ncbi:MAG: Gfo/Idh/MocA family oxidoreductase [Chthonomonadales bacterium]
MSEPKRIALVGVGHWGRFILRDLKSLGCTVIAIARSEESIQRAKDGGADEIVDSLDRIGKVDGIVVATPSSLHAESLTPIVELGLPIFVEKPLTVDYASSRRLTDAAPDRLFVMEKWRYHPGVELMRDIVASKELGETIGIKATRVRWGNPHYDVDCIWNLIPHELSIVDEVLGYMPKPRAAVSESIDGVPVSLQALMGNKPWASVEVSCNEREVRQEVRLICEKGVVKLADPYAGHVIIEHFVESDQENPRVELREHSQEFPLKLELMAFVEHLNGGVAPRASAEQSTRIVAMIEELRKLAGITC